MSSEVTVKQLATTVGIPVERLLTQLNEAGVPAGAEDAPISEHQKLQLLNYLRRSHGAKPATDEPNGTTARKAADPRPPLGVGRAGARVPASRPNPNARAGKSVNVEVKRKRSFVKGEEAPVPAAKPAASAPGEADGDSHKQPPAHQPAPEQTPPAAPPTATPSDAVAEPRAAHPPADAPAATASATPSGASPQPAVERSAPSRGPAAESRDDRATATANPPGRTTTGPAEARRASTAQSPAGRAEPNRPGPGRGAGAGRTDGRPATAARPAPARRPGGGRVVMDEARRRNELEARRAEEDARRLAEQEENERRAREEAQRRAEADAKRRAAAKAAAAAADKAPTTAEAATDATTGIPATAVPETALPETALPETTAGEAAAATETAPPTTPSPAPSPAPAAAKAGAKARPGIGTTGVDDSDEDADSKRRAGKKAPERVEKDKKAAKPARKETWAKQAVASDDDDDNGVISRPAVRRRGKKGAKPQLQDKHGFQRPTAPVVREVEVPAAITVGELASRMSVKAAQVVKALFKQGMMVTVNQTLDRDTAMLLVEEMGHTAVEGREQDAEDSLLAWLEEEQGQIEQSPRPPVVTIMGHVDHGKTSLLDYIRRTKVASGEAGGITQHIGAYHVDTPKGTVSFLDTPGHAAFSAMRARGAKVTDLVVLVVAADDGVMPQTVEAIQHARASGVPIIVAVNKMDLPDANPDRVMQELVQREVVPEAWGGDTMMVQVSAKTGDGIDDLLDAILLQAEVLELTASVDGAARGTIVESSIEKGRGPVATVLVSSGTLNVGDTIVSGAEYGRVRAMFDEAGRPVKSAGPSIPVQVLGLSGAPNAGDDVLAVTDERRAREVAEFRQDRERQTRMDDQRGASLDQLFTQFKDGELKSVNIILKADVQGSVEALKDSLVKLSNDEVKVTVVASGVGGIAESDANLAVTSNAILLGFNVRADPAARRVIEEKGLDLRYYSIIYELIDDVKLAISGLLSPIVTEEIIGLAQVRDVFRSSKFGAIAGCMVVEGQIRRNAPIRVLRNNVVVFEGALESLRRFKDDVTEVKAGTECGIGVKNYNDVQPGDQIEVFERTERARVL